MLVCAAVLVPSSSRLSAAGPANSLELAEGAIAQLEAGDPAGAASTTRQALESDAGDPLLHNLAATIFMSTGNTAEAAAEWRAVLSDSSNDPVALYGLGLVALSRGQLEAASRYLAQARARGDSATCLLAERYTEYVAGSPSQAAVALPEPLAPFARGISGVAFAGSDPRGALENLRAALAALPGDPFDEPAGVLMSFDRHAPLRPGSGRLPQGSGLGDSRRRNRGPASSGVLSIAAGEAATPGCYVTFRIDGVPVSIVNAPPYKLAWDTAREPNGVHHVEVIVSDRQGHEIGRAVREVRTLNANAPAWRPADRDSAARVAAGLWRFLALRPSRRVLALHAGRCARSAGNAAEAAGWFEMAAAVDPSNADVRRELQPTLGSGSTAVWRGSAQAPTVALTFDDGPKPGVTERLLAALTSAGAQATFFVIGKHAAQYAELTRQLAQAGMQVENHSYTHPNLTVLPELEVERELVRTLAAVHAATGRAPRYFRPPGGNLDVRVTKAAARWGLTPCMWTVDGEALESGTPERLVQYVVTHASPGAIILLHNGRGTTVEAVPAIIQGLRRRGFRLVTLDQLVGSRGSPGIVPGTPRATGLELFGISAD